MYNKFFLATTMSWHDHWCRGCFPTTCPSEASKDFLPLPSHISEALHLDINKWQDSNTFLFLLTYLETNPAADLFFQKIWVSWVRQRKRHGVFQRCPVVLIQENLGWDEVHGWFTTASLDRCGHTRTRQGNASLFRKACGHLPHSAPVSNT